MLITFFTIFAAFSFSFSATALESPESPRKGRHKAQAAISYFNSTGNFADDSQSESLANGGSFSNIQTDLGYAYDLAPDWRVGGGFSYAMADSDDGRFQRSDSGLNEAHLMGQKWYDLGRFELAPQLEAYMSFVEVDAVNGDAVLYGEGAMRVRAGAWIGAPMKGYRPYGYLGFEYRDGGRSSLLPYEAGIKARFGEWWAQGSARGVMSVTDDNDTANPLVRNLYLQVVNGGSFKYYSVNPSYTEVTVAAGRNWGQWGFFGEAALTVLGTNAADGFTITAGVSYSPSFGDGRAGEEFNDRMAPIEEKTFDIKNDKYDHSLFEGDSKVNPEDRDYSPPPEPPPAPKKTKSVDVQLKVIKKKKARKSSKSLDKILNEAEKSLEGN